MIRHREMFTGAPVISGERTLEQVGEVIATGEVLSQVNRTARDLSTTRCPRIGQVDIGQSLLAVPLELSSCSL